MKKIAVAKAKKSLFCWCSRKFSWSFSEIFVLVLRDFRACSRRFSCLFSEIFVLVLGDFRGIQIYTFNNSCLKYPTVSPSKMQYFCPSLVSIFLTVLISLFQCEVRSFSLIPFFPHHLNSTTFFQFRIYFLVFVALIVILSCALTSFLGVLASAGTRPVAAWIFLVLDANNISKL